MNVSVRKLLGISLIPISMIWIIFVGLNYIRYGFMEYPDFKAKDFVILGDYKSIRIPMSYPDVVSDEELDRIADDALSEDVRSYNWEIRTSGTVTDDSFVQMTYTCADRDTGDAVPNTGGTDVLVSVLENPYGFGFYSDLVGHAVGETVRIVKTYDASDMSVQEDVRGKSVLFTVQLTGIKLVPPVGDEVVWKISDGKYKTVSEYLTTQKEKIVDLYQDDYRMQLQKSLAKELLDCCDVKLLSERFVIWYRYHQQQVQSHLADRAGVSVSEYQEQQGLKDPEDLTQDDVRSEQAVFLICLAIAEDMDITLSDEEFDAFLETAVSDYGFSDVTAMLAVYDKDYLYDIAVSNRVIERLAESLPVTVS